MVSMNEKRALVVITGASRGIGKELAIQLAKLFNVNDSTLILLARNEAALNEVKQEIAEKSPNVSVELVVADLGQHYTGSIDERIRTLEEKIKFDIRLVVHNAGSVGDITKRSSELSDEQQWADYLQSNFISTVYLNNLIYSAIGKEAFPSFTQYSVGKAAREAYFRALAAEHHECRVLNYSPGPVDTQMHTEVSEKSYDEHVRQLFSKRYEEGSAQLHRKLLSTEETVKRLIAIIEQDKFETGTRIDYFDQQEK